MSITESVLLKLFFYEEKIRKILIIFDIENWLWKWEFWHFRQLLLNWLQESKNRHDFSKQSALKIEVFKKCPKLIFFNEKKIEKDSDNFWRRKLTFKVRNCHFSIAWFRAEVDLTKNLFYEKVLFFTQLLPPIW